MSQMHPLLRLIAVWLLVMGAAAAALKALDVVPSLLAGASHRARVYASLEEAERALGARIWLPGYYPEELQWPPSRVEVSPTEPATVVLRIAGRDSGADRLIVAQSIGGLASVPSYLLAPGRTIGTTKILVGTRPARLVRVLLGPRELHDLSWDHDGRRITLRYSGPVDRLLLLAGSLERRATETARPE